MNAAAMHMRAHRHAKEASAALERAITAEGGLEWTGQLEELMQEVDHIARRLKDYAELADAESAMPAPF